MSSKEIPAKHQKPDSEDLPADGDQPDEELFRSLMGDVKPLAKEPRIKLTTAEALDENLKRRREAAVAERIESKEPLTGSYIEQVHPLDIVAFKRPGIQHGVYKNLRLGKYSVDARLDLHRLTVDQARNAVADFIKDCIAHDIRCGLISHGKGENRQPQPALLKSCVAYWLPQLPEVMAFHSAQKQHGGVGATYVLLKKSEKKRLENLENHQRKPR